ncbi:protein translocase subunit SecDF [Fulvitalea axinellae]|uniref:Multifunctional fusion protein n=1 Tax=Fulvitalea axinellae TaxID=1182444 RepID=A0AAU9CN79_9BACT|nr:protein translocase subunit SecDF [Fulvitalea axinellae]
MRNKGLVVSLTIIITLLCIYYLSFTWASQRVKNEATQYATEQSGKINYGKQQQYLDSVWKEPVFNLFGAEYTLQEVKETELSLGLDLQGGMHVTLEVSPSAIIEGLSGYSKDENFKKALEQAREEQKSSQSSFVSLFVDAYEGLVPNGNLAPFFANSKNRDKVNASSSNQEVQKFLDTEMNLAIDRAFNILRTRVDRFGTSQPNIQKLEGTGRIQIELPGVDNPARVRKLLQGVANLQFWVVSTPDKYQSAVMAINQKLVDELQMASKSTLDGDTSAVAGEVAPEDELASLTGADSTSTDSTKVAQELDSALNAQASPLLSLLKNATPGALVYDLNDTSKINRILNRPDVKALIPRDIKFLWEVKPQKLDNGDELISLFALEVGRNGQPALSGDVVKGANQQFDRTGHPAVGMSMTAPGARKWKRLTGQNINRRIAIVLDDYVYSAPNVQSEIPNGNSEITGNFTLEEAKDLANILRSGSLPAPTRIVEEAIVGPTLGKEAQNQGLTSIFAGLAVVVLFMFAYYAKGGLVANIALVFNIFFILGVLANLQAALTLPGIAGIVLTIGMSIDANVLIFERIREELRNGLSLTNAISKGYSKAFSSIFDANVTTFLVAAILYVLGLGPVKGFAITLMIGIATSFFTAVFVTRVIMSWMTKKGNASNMSFALPWSKDVMVGANFDFLGKRKMAYTFSIAFIALGIVALVIKGGLNMGVDFKGGRSYVVQFDQPVSATSLKTSLMGSFNNEGTEVKTFGANNTLKITTTFMINDDTDAADETVKNALVAGLEKATNEKFAGEGVNPKAGEFSIQSSSKVGATIADDIKTSSLEAGVLALIVLFLYILLRFRKLQFSAGAVVALTHDVLFVISAFAIARLFGVDFEIDQVFVAAILTIVGYSINDTVVVFDRIREELGATVRKVNRIEVFNRAINSTISRTLITSLTTFIVVMILLIFGGEVLRSFSFAMVIGVLIGTYSSIFIATPVVIDLTKDEVEPKKETAKK